jgi:phage repressor protein C with HTH and peptisase S24 domain
MNDDEGKRLGERFRGIPMTKVEFARIFKVPGGASMISQHISGNRPISMDAAIAYSRGFNCSLEDISPRLAEEAKKAAQAISGDVVQPSPIVVGSAVTSGETDSYEITLMNAYGSMGEGNDCPDDEVPIDLIRLKKDWVQEAIRPLTSPTNLYFVHALGDSMQPTLNHGDILLIDTGVRAADVDGVYVLRAHKRLFIKRVRQRLDGSYEISSDNPTVKTVDVLNGEHEVEILGKVVWVWNGRKV